MSYSCPYPEHTTSKFIQHEYITIIGCDCWFSNTRLLVLAGAGLDWLIPDQLLAVAGIVSDSIRLVNFVDKQVTTICQSKSIIFITVIHIPNPVLSRVKKSLQKFFIHLVLDLKLVQLAMLWI